MTMKNIIFVGSDIANISKKKGKELTDSQRVTTAKAIKLIEKTDTKVDSAVNMKSVDNF